MKSNYDGTLEMNREEIVQDGIKEGILPDPKAKAEIYIDEHRELLQTWEINCPCGSRFSMRSLTKSHALGKARSLGWTELPDGTWRCHQTNPLDEFFARTGQAILALGKNDSLYRNS